MINIEIIEIFCSVFHTGLENPVALMLTASQFGAATCGFDSHPECCRTSDGPGIWPGATEAPPGHVHPTHSCLPLC